MGIEFQGILLMTVILLGAFAVTTRRAPVRGPSLRAFRALLPRGLRCGPWLLPAVRCHGTLPHRSPLSAPLVRHGESTRAGPPSVGQVLLHALRFSTYPRRFRCEIMSSVGALAAIRVFDAPMVAIYEQIISRRGA